MPKQQVRVVLGGKSLIYTIEELPPEVEFADHMCMHCGGKLDLVVSFIQMGFWEDTHINATICKECGRAIAYRQVLPFCWEVNNA